MKSILGILAILISLQVTASTGIKKTTCGSDLTPFGKGGDAFPWSLATNFPWNDIHGVWQAHGKSNITFKFKVIRTTQDIKQLAVEITNTRKKTNQVTRGVGVITSNEPNVIKLVTDGVLLKIAMFKTLDIQANLVSCGDQVLATSTYKLNCDEQDCDTEDNDSPDQVYKSSLLLKKVSNSLKFKVK